MTSYRNINGQEIISLTDDETCSISEYDLFKDIKRKRKFKEIKGSKFYLPNYDTDLIQQRLYAGSEYFEQNVLQYVDFYIEKEPVAIDIGANIGNHTLYWANECQAKKIYAYEPIVYTFEILKKNVNINNLEDIVKIYNVGLADKEGFGEIKSFCKQNLGGTRLKELQSDTEFIIPLCTLDSYNIQEDKIDIIKIDVEGMETAVLKGAKKTIKKYKPVIIIESFPDSFEETNYLLEKMGYKKENDFGAYLYLYIHKDKK